MWNVATVGGAGWLVSLPFLGIGMGCFWLQRDIGGMGGAALGVGALAALSVALLLPGLTPLVFAPKRSGRSLVLAIGRSLLIAVVCLVAASLLSAVDALRPEDVSFFGYEFASSHALAAAVPTSIALALTAISVWQRGSDRRLAWIAPAVVVAVLGVGMWWWSAGTGYDAIRFTNADEIVLMAQTVALAGLLFACIASAVLSGTRAEETANRAAA